MLTPQDVRAAQFEKNIRGYRTEEVDRFLDKVEEQLKQDEDQAEELRRQIAELTAENQRLHKEMESYEADGDMLKSALINAQRMGENVIREANQKSEEILHRANLRGDDIIRDANELLQKASDRADEIINEANEKKLAQEREYDRVRLEVTRFKSDVLNLYRSHVESLSRLPEFQKEEPAEDAPAEDEAAAAETTAAAVTEEIAEAQPAAADVDAEDETPADEKTSEEFWAQDHTLQIILYQFKKTTEEIRYLLMMISDFLCILFCKFHKFRRIKSSASLRSSTPNNCKFSVTVHW